MGKGTITGGGTDGLYSVVLNHTNTDDDDAARDAWCADLTENLSGVVAICEIPGEPDAVLIRPGYASAAAYSGARDGILKKPKRCKPPEFFYNLAMLPGVQRWKPTYRFATITELDKVAKTCSVIGQNAYSTQQNLDVSWYDGSVAIDYMN